MKTFGFESERLEFHMIFNLIEVINLLWLVREFQVSSSIHIGALHYTKYFVARTKETFGQNNRLAGTRHLYRRY